MCRTLLVEVPSQVCKGLTVPRMKQFDEIPAQERGRLGIVKHGGHYVVAITNDTLIIYDADRIQVALYQRAILVFGANERLLKLASFFFNLERFGEHGENGHLVGEHFVAFSKGDTERAATALIDQKWLANACLQLMVHYQIVFLQLCILTEVFINLRLFARTLYNFTEQGASLHFAAFFYLRLTVGMSQGKQRFFAVPFSSVVKRTRGGQQVAGFEDNFSDIGVVISIEVKEELIQ